MNQRQPLKKFFSLSVATLVTTTGIFAILSACTDQQAKAKPNILVKDAPRPGVVAKIAGEEITEEQLIGDDKLDFFDLKKREYELKMDRVNKLLVEKLVGSEAKKASMSTEDFIEKKIVGKEITPTEKEFKKFVEEKHIPESQINPQIKERINAYLTTMKKQDLVQAYIAKLTKGQPAEVYFKKPKMEVAVDPGNSPALGPDSAPIKIVEFSDFQCPFCSRGADVVHQIQKKYGKKVRISFKQFPLPMHKDARPAAEASLCINEQSTDKFWKFHDLAFKAQDKLDTAGLEASAKSAGANVDKFKECIASKKFADAVQKDLDYGEKLGVKSTPSFFVNGQVVNGAVPIEQFSEIIDDELESAKK